MSEYIPPSDVTSPRKQWLLISVLDDPKKPGECALALGKWDNRPVLAMRWNGTADNPIGNPQSRGLPTWFIVPGKYNEQLVATLPEAMQTLAWNFLPGPHALWMEDIKTAMEGMPTDRWRITSSRKKGPGGENLISLGFEDPVRSGPDSTFYVDLPVDTAHDDVTKAVRAAFRRYFRSHPVTRGA